MWTVTWALKVSKRCNLRCRYCYEWNDLARPDRLTPAHWAAALQAISRVHRRHESRTGERGRSYVVWHGGEPLLLPVAYAREVLAAQRELLGDGRLRERDYVNVVQTSLYSLDDAWLELLVEAGFEAGVSLDLVPGVRLTAGGRETEERTIANLERLIAHRIPVVGAVVLAGHTEGHLTEIHDFFAERGLPFQVNLLIPSPAVHSGDPLDLAWDRAATALERLFAHWISTGCRIEIQPLAGYLATVLIHRLGLERESGPVDPWSGRLVVDISGEVRRSGDIGVQERMLGNLFTESVDRLLAADGPKTLASDQARRDRHCTACPYRTACDGSPVLAVSRAYPPGPCPVAARVMDFIDRRLDDWGCNELEMIHGEWLGARLARTEATLVTNRGGGSQ
jgi:uncharacterized protein